MRLQKLFEGIRMFIPTLGLPELLIILFIVLLIFGAKRIPDIARSFGQAIKEFKKSSREVEEQPSSTSEKKE